MSEASPKEIVTALLDRYGSTYAQEAGIRLSDRPAPLYQLLVLSTLLSARISASVAVAATRELIAAGYRTPKAMFEASWQDRVDALDRGHYRRYDDRTSTMLGNGAELVIQHWGGDLRKLRKQAGGNSGTATSLLTEFPGIGPTGADIYLREVQGVWPEFAPHLDARVLDSARDLSLPGDADQLAKLVNSPAQLPNLAAALVRVSGSRNRADDLIAAASPGRSINHMGGTPMVR
jgi:endonuclease III